MGQEIRIREVVGGAIRIRCLLRGLFLATGISIFACSNVAHMQAKAAAGDEEQLERILQIVARHDYPYATRKRAAIALGDLGNPRAVPVLLGVLNDFDQRTTLKQAAVTALGKIGDTTAVAPISRLLDRSIQEASSDLRMVAIPVLGSFRTTTAAEVLVRALRLYDMQMLRREMRTPMGMFSGEEQPPIYGPYARLDSVGRRVDNPSIGLMPGQQQGPLNMFGLDPRAVTRDMYDPTPEERNLAHVTLVQMGKLVVPVIRQYMVDEQMTHTLEQELFAIVAEVGQKDYGGTIP